MTSNEIVHAFREKVAEQVRLSPEGVDRYRVLTPFRFDDGDHLALVLRRDAEGWLLSDEGHTFMHLSYEIEERDLHRGTRQGILTNALCAFGVEDCEGVLTLRVRGDGFGDALFSVVQAILRIADVGYLSRERVRSTFQDDFRGFIAEVVPEARLTWEWTHPTRDPERRYPVDCAVNGMDRPLFVFALATDDQVRDATIVLHQLEAWGVRSRSVGVFENQEEVNRKVLARFSDVCGKQFSSLGVRDRIRGYLEESMSEGTRHG
jgi:hypothetical protein